MGDNLPRILFVDDEKCIVDGLQRRMRSQRAVWESYFARSAEEAINYLNTHLFTIAVVDLKMPGINGMDLLASLKKQFPAVTRVVLSGTTDKSACYDMIKVAKQFLAKPCPTDALVRTLQNLLHIRNSMHPGILDDAISRLDEIPVFPDVYLELKETLDRPNHSLNELAKVLEKDPSMTARVLQISNSPFFRVSKEAVRDVPTACKMIGQDTLSELVLVSCIFNSMDQTACPKLPLDEIWKESTELGIKAGFLSQHLGLPPPDQKTASLSGLLHGVGKLVLATVAPTPYGKCLAEQRTLGKPLHEIEEAELGANHATVGAYFCGLWGLPVEVVETVHRYIQPSRYASSGKIQASTAVHGAAAYLRDRGYRGLPPWDEALLKELNTPNPKGSWTEALKTQSEEERT